MAMVQLLHTGKVALLYLVAGAFAAPHELRSEHLPPWQVGLALPSSGLRLSWQNQGSKRGDVQSAWQVQVSHGSQTFWDSGKRQTAEQQVTVPIDLQPDTDYEWRVQSWVG